MPFRRLRRTCPGGLIGPPLHGEKFRGLGRYADSPRLRVAGSLGRVRRY